MREYLGRRLFPELPREVVTLELDAETAVTRPPRDLAKVSLKAAKTWTLEQIDAYAAALAKQHGHCWESIVITAPASVSGLSQ